MIIRVPRRIWLPVGLGALIGTLVLALASAVGAQTPGETPATAQATGDVNATPTEEATPGPEVKTIVSITVDPAIQPIPKGDEFEVQVSIDQVEHMAGFEFSIGYDPKRVEPVFVSGSSNSATAQQETPAKGGAAKVVKTANLGQFLNSSGRPADEVLCSDATAQGSTALVTCNLLGAPLCAGGQPGASGSGVLGTVFFKSKGGGTTTLHLAKTDLALDDFSDCTVEVTGTAELPGACLPIRDAAGSSATQLSCAPDRTSALLVEGPVDADGVAWVRLEGLGWGQVDYLQTTGRVPPIPHRRQDATVELAKSSGTSGVLIGGIVGVVVVVVVGGSAGYLYYRRRQGGGAV